MTRDWKYGICGVGLVAVALLFYALFGRPPYPFFTVLRYAVAAAAGLCAWFLYTESKRYLPISLGLLIVAGIHLFGKMRRSDWALFNWAAVAGIFLSLLILLVSLRRTKPHAEVRGGG